MFLSSVKRVRFTVQVYETYRLGRVCALHTGTLEEESDRVQSLALALAEGTHEFLQLGGSLDLEEHLVVVVGDLDVKVFAIGRRLLSLSRGASVLAFARHDVAMMVFELRDSLVSMRCKMQVSDRQFMRTQE